MPEDSTLSRTLHLRKRLKDEHADADSILSILKEVAELNMTKEILKKTGIGKTINTFTSDERIPVCDAAKPILSKWKKLGTGNSKRTISDSGTLHTNGVTEKSEDRDNNANQSKLGSHKRPRTGLVASKKVSILPLEHMNLPADPQRKKTVQLFSALFATQQTEHKYTESRVTLVATHMEAAMAAEHGAGTKEYKGKYRTLKSNLSANEDLKLNLLNGALLASSLMSFKAEDFLSEKKKDDRKKEQEEIISSLRQDWLDSKREDIMKAAGIEIKGGMYRCGRCGSDKTTHYQKQTRSADEPMTVFVQCTKCPNRWRC